MFFYSVMCCVSLRASGWGLGGGGACIPQGCVFGCTRVRGLWWRAGVCCYKRAFPINRALIDDQQEKYGKENPEQKELYSS